MKKTMVLVLTVLVMSSCASKRTKPEKKNNATLAEVVEAVQSEYAIALHRFQNDTVKITKVSLQSADLTLTTSKVLSGSGDITILLFKPSSTYRSTRSTAITYTLSKTVPKAALTAQIEGFKNGRHPLADLIYETAKSFQELKPKLADLTQDNFVIDLVFSIENDSATGLTFTVWGIGADASLESDKTVTHELRLTFSYVK